MSNQSPPTVTVIIPTFDRAQYLGDALRSVAEQTHPAAQVIVVDDYSPTPIVLPDVPGLEVTLLRHARNQGAGAARNTGLAHAKGDWVLFLDDDDLLTPTRIQLAIDGMGEARFHACAVEYFSPDGKAISGKRFSGDLRSTFLDGSEPNGRHPSLGQVMLRREDVLQFNPTYRRAQDTDWWLRMTDRAVFAWSPEVGLRVRVHDGPRKYLKNDYIFNTRRRLALEHGQSSTRQRRAHLYRQTAGAAIRAGRRWQAIYWSSRSLFAVPTLLGWKQLARAIVGRPGKE